jgi:hypothetical protein
VSVGPDEASVSVDVAGPWREGAVSASTIEIPVVSPIGLRAPSEGVVQVRRGETLSYAISNRLPETVTVAVGTRWQGAVATPEPMTQALSPGEVKALAVKADIPHAGLWDLQIEAGWPGGSLLRTVHVDVVDAVLPKGFTAQEVAGLTLRMGAFNSLGDQWADKPVKINGVVVGRLPITGGTLRWHDDPALDVPAEVARKVFAAGLQAGGDLELAVSVDNHVGNCFKVRNLQVSLLGRAGGKYLSTTARDVTCSDAGWLYAEGKCVRLGEPVPLGAVTLIRER